MSYSSTSFCEICGHAIPDHETRCVICFTPTPDPPNVRAASAPEERRALESRFAIALAESERRGCLRVLEAFRAAVRSSFAVWCNRAEEVLQYVKDGNRNFVSFYRQQQSLARLPQDNVWDRYREPADTTVFPYYHRDIVFASLSIDHYGVSHFGDVAVVLNEEHIRNRATVFEKNSRIFIEENQLAGKALPVGHRATWEARDILAVAKLASRFSADTEPSEFARILLEPTVSETADFIEVHIFGGLNRASFFRVVAQQPPDPGLRAILRSIEREVVALGGHFEFV